MKDNEKYWLDLYNKGLIEIDFDTGFVYSWLCGGRTDIKKKNKRKIGSSGYKREHWYVHLAAGPNRQTRYNILAHRFIWIVANGDISNGYELNHKNGIKDDNRLENLEIATRQENNLHKCRVLKKLGGTSCGENSIFSKLIWEKVIEIRRLWNEKLKNMREIAEEFDICYPTVSNIVYYRSWINEEKCKK